MMKDATRVIVCAVLCMAISFPLHAAPQLKPATPAFLNYFKKPPSSRAPRVNNSGHALGLIPSPVDLSHLRGKRMGQRRPGVVRGAFPATYDLRATGKLTSVRDQSIYGTCWAFAAIASLESGLMPAETRDFSENNMVNRSGYDFGFSDGGQLWMATAYLNRWAGPINETDDPYPNPYGSPTGLSVQKHLQDVLIIPDRSGPLDNDNIKQALMDYGAVMTSIYMDEGAAYYNSTTHAYCYTGGNDTNHAVTIVGWDDAYPSANFPVAPDGNGAFIVRNSWGSAWGDNGYFYISYYDALIGSSGMATAVFVAAETPANKNIYEHDPLGMTTTITDYTNTIWGANVFTAHANDTVTAVGLYVLDVNASYEISIYDTYDGVRFTGLRTQQSGTIAVPGYHTIQLNAPVSIVYGHTFCVVVKLTTTGDAELAVEFPWKGFASPTAAAGQSYVSENGVAWDDLTTWFPDTNVCLKAYTAQPPSEQGTLSRAVAYPNPVNFSTAVNGTIKFANLTDNASIKIFDVTGRLVKTLGPGTPGNDGPSGTATWDGRNESGTRVAMGMYLYLISDSAGNKARGKIGVVK